MNLYSFWNGFVHFANFGHSWVFSEKWQFRTAETAIWRNTISTVPSLAWICHQLSAVERFDVWDFMIFWFVSLRRRTRGESRRYRRKFRVEESYMRWVFFWSCEWGIGTIVVDLMVEFLLKFGSVAESRDEYCSPRLNSSFLNFDETSFFAETSRTDREVLFQKVSISYSPF